MDLAIRPLGCEPAAAAGPALLAPVSRRGLTLALLVGAHLVALVLLAYGQAAIAIGAVFASHMLVLWATLRPGSTLLGPVVKRLDTSAREVWLTIDDGPSADTEAVLALLERHRARATWFLVGERASRAPQKVRAVLAAGHEVGNHSLTHPSARFWSLPPAAMAREIEGAQHALGALGPPPRWFRAAVGMSNPFVDPVLRRLGLVHVGWSARGFDATTADPARVVRRVLRGLRPGAIVLLHEGAAHGRSVEIIARVLEALDARGYRCVLPRPDPCPDPR